MPPTMQIDSPRIPTPQTTPSGVSRGDATSQGPTPFPANLSSSPSPTPVDDPRDARFKAYSVYQSHDNHESSDGFLPSPRRYKRRFHVNSSCQGWSRFVPRRLIDAWDYVALSWPVDFKMRRRDIGEAWFQVAQRPESMASSDAMARLPPPATPLSPSPIDELAMSRAVVTVETAITTIGVLMPCLIIALAGIAFVSDDRHPRRRHRWTPYDLFCVIMHQLVKEGIFCLLNRTKRLWLPIAYTIYVVMWAMLTLVRCVLWLDRFAYAMGLFIYGVTMVTYGFTCYSIRRAFGFVLSWMCWVYGMPYHYDDVVDEAFMMSTVDSDWDARKFPKCKPYYGKRGVEFDNFVSDPTVECWAAAIALLSYMYGTRKLGIRYKRAKKIKLSLYCDSSYGSTPKPMFGYVVFANGAPISWSSKTTEDRATELVRGGERGAMCWVQELDVHP